MKNNYRYYLPKRLIEQRGGARLESKTGLLAALVFIVAVSSSSGCSTLGVRPWDHDLLAEQAMQVDSYPLQTTIDDHIYFSKEASSGGRSFAGGGCGCN
jgi:Domain of unknown function (DUF4266)